MTLAPGPFGPSPAPNYDTSINERADDLTALPSSTTDDLHPSTTSSGDIDSLADASIDDTDADTPGLARGRAPAGGYVPSPLSHARPTFAPRPNIPLPVAFPAAPIADPTDLAPARPFDAAPAPVEPIVLPNTTFAPSRVPTSYESTASVDATVYMHPGDHLQGPEPDEHDWQRVDRTPRLPVTDYSVFRYVRPSAAPARPAPESNDTPAPAADLSDAPVGARGMRPDPSAAESSELAATPESAPMPEPSTATAAIAPSPDFLVLASMLGMGLANVDSNGTVWPLNEAGATLLEALGSAHGGHAPNAIIEALSFARAGNKPFLRDTPAPSPEARHISVAAFAGNNGGGLVAMRDHTEETLLQERLLQSEKMASVGQLVSGVAHELNNPLTGVMGFAQLLLARDLDLTVRGQIQTIYGEAERAAKIVQNLLSFARRRKPTKEMCDINALLQRVLELRSYDFNIRNISLDMTMDSRMESVWADPDQIQQVFFNVIKNAEQAMIDAHRGGKLSVSTTGIADGVRISIADSGPGIPAEVQRRIFDPFFTTKEAGEGTGLGLTICYGIMEEHSGRIWTENLPAGGASFNIELPVGKPDEPDFYDRGVDDNSLLPAPSVSSRKVLVVDDEESIRLLLHDILRLDDHAVRIAKSGLEAFEFVRSEHFDVIITDMKMPGMDGASFYREVRLRDPALARRIVFITGDTVSPDTRAFLQRVSNPVLSKPFKIGPLRDAIETVLHQQ